MKSNASNMASAASSVATSIHSVDDSSVVSQLTHSTCLSTPSHKSNTRILQTKTKPGVVTGGGKASFGYGSARFAPDRTQQRGLSSSVASGSTVGSVKKVAGRAKKEPTGVLNSASLAS
jgi:hypothetical protein